MNQSVILTVVGSDRPGLTKALADAVYKVGGNWLESHLSRLGGQYVGSVLVELPADSLGDLEAAANAIDANGLSVSISPSLAADDRSGDVLAIEIVGQDRPGIVREVTTVLAGLHVNIEGFSSEIEGSAWSGSPLFRGRANLLLPPDVSIDRLREAVRLGAGLDAKNRLTPEAQTRALDCLSRFGQRLQGIPPHRVRVVGTNTLRKMQEGAAGDQVAAVDDDRRDRLDALTLPQLLRLAHGIRMGAGIEHRRRLRDIQARATGGIEQRGTIARIAALGEVDREQRMFQRPLPVEILQTRPMEQAVRVERVVDAASRLHVHREAQICRPRADYLAQFGRFVGAAAIFALDMLADILALLGHARIELERLEADLGRHLALQRFERLFQPAQSDDAPGAGNVRYEIDAQRRGHRELLLAEA